jgi:hypothetical protein
MRKLFFTLTLVACLAVPAVAGERGKMRGAGTPQRYAPHALDGAIVQLTNAVDGRSWSAWAYRNGAEYDLALSFSTAPGVWSEPSFFGLDDGVDQRRPALAVDARGTLYVAYDDGDGTIVLRALRAGSNEWTPAVTVASQAGRFGAANLVVLGESLVVGYRDGDGVTMAVWPLLQPPGNSTSSIYDGPDPTGGMKDDEGDEDEESSSDDNLPSNGVLLIPVGDAAGGGNGGNGGGN